MRSQLSKLRLAALLGLIGFVAFFVWARSPLNYEAAIENGVGEIDVARDFNLLFPEANNFISYFSGALGYGYGEPSWTSKIGLHGRYTFVAKFDIEFDWSRRFPERVGAAKFYLLEVSRIEHLEDGRISISYSNNQRVLGTEEWMKIKESRGDFSAIGYAMDKENPMPEFERVWK